MINYKNIQDTTIINNFSDIDWDMVSKFISLTKDRFYKWSNYLNPDILVENNTMNYIWCMGDINMIRLYQRYIIKSTQLPIPHLFNLEWTSENVYLICKYQHLSNRFILDNMDKLDMVTCSRYQDLSNNVIKKILEKWVNINNKEMMMNILVYQNLSLSLLGYIIDRMISTTGDLSYIHVFIEYQNISLNDLLKLIVDNNKNFAKFAFSEKVNFVLKMINIYGNEAEVVFNLFPELIMKGK